MKKLSIVVACGVGMSLAIAQGMAHEHGHGQSDSSMAPSIRPVLGVPSSIRAEHEHLHHQLEAAMATGGKTGEQARKVAEVLGPHFAKEEAYAMPPLGLLESLTHGKPVS